MKTIEERLKNLLKRPASPAAPAMPDAVADVDYNLVSRYAEGTADADDAARIAALIRQDPDLAALVEKPRKDSGAILPLPARAPRRMFRFLATAASVLLVAGIGWMVHVRSGRMSQPLPVVMSEVAAPVPQPASVPPAFLKPAPITKPVTAKLQRLPSPSAPLKSAPLAKTAVEPPRPEPLPSASPAPADKAVMANARLSSSPPAPPASAQVVEADAAAPSLRAKAERKRKAVVSVAATPVPPRAATKAPPSPRYNAFALLVGVDRHEHDPALRNGALDDVRHVAAKLREFEFDQVVTLTNTLATRAGISAAIAALEHAAATNAALFVYCAGDAPDVDDLARNACLVPFDNAAMDARKNVQMEANVATAPSLFNNSFIVYDNRVSPMQVQQQRSAQSAVNVLQQQAAPNVQTLVNLNTVQQNVNGLFARTFIEALDQVAAGGSVSADDVQGYVARQQMLPAEKEGGYAVRTDEAREMVAPVVTTTPGDTCKKDTRDTYAVAGNATGQELAQKTITIRTAGQTAADAETAQALGTVAGRTAALAATTAPAMAASQSLTTVENQAAPARQLFLFRRTQTAPAK